MNGAPSATGSPWRAFAAIVAAFVVAGLLGANYGTAGVILGVPLGMATAALLAGGSLDADKG